MLSLLRYKTYTPELVESRLLNENSFYDSFLKDLNKCQSEAIIESPFITNRRLALLLPTLEKLKKRSVRIAIITKRPA
jgi:HKD family nuclease